MPYEFFLALRYFRSRQRRKLARVTSLVAIAGIAAGVAALMVSLSLANGFRDEMRDKILRGTAHITVARSDGQPVANYREIAAKVATVPEVISAAGTTYAGAFINGSKGSDFAVLRGVDFASQAQRLEIEQTLIDGSVADLYKFPPPNRSARPVVIGSELAARSGLKVGDDVGILTTRGTVFVDSHTRVAHVVGIFRSGLFEYDSTWVYYQLDPDSTMSDSGAAVISVQVRNIYDVKQVTAKIKGLLGSAYTTIDWQEANRPLFTALALERRLGIVIIGLIVFIAALNITTTLILVVVERRRDIAVLNTLGATARSVMSIFMIEGALVGALGAFFGVLLGTAAILIANRYHLISLSADVYSISAVPLHFNLRDAVLAALVALVLSVVATLYPARAAGRLRPVEIFRDGQ
ncbi:MAG TPA: ABC transporter permease [Pyrinomonadaceae bacterium]|nr:ABC transporter permease [Pyrinomonadaceae bacterium]